MELKFDMHIIGHCPTYYTDFGEFMVNSLFYRSPKKDSYSLQPFESNSKKHDSV